MFILKTHKIKSNPTLICHLIIYSNVINRDLIIFLTIVKSSQRIPVAVKNSPKNVKIDQRVLFYGWISQ